MHWVDITNEELLLKSSIKDVLTLTDTSGIHHVSVLEFLASTFFRSTAFRIRRVTSD